MFLFVFLKQKNKNIKSRVFFQTNKLPQLYIDKNLIKRSDNKTSIQLKGVSTMAFVYYNYDINQLIGVLNEVKLWKINLIGIFINPDNLIGQENKLDKVINWAEKNYIYVYLMPAVNIHDKTKSEMEQVDDFPKMMEILASKYADKKNIIYGLWAEPRYVIWPQWKFMAQNILDRIIMNNPDAVILITGIQFGRYFDTKDNDLNTKNIIYDFHDYPAPNKKELEPLLKYKADFLWSSFVDKYPVLIGEFGGVYLTDFSSQEDLQYISQVLAGVNKSHLSYTAYTIDQEGGLGLINWQTDLPTIKGKLIKKDLEDFPPTNFSK